MTKKKCRKIAIDYLFNASESFTDISSKTTIDDRGTQSEYGYTLEECDEIKVELDYLMRKLSQLQISR